MGLGEAAGPQVPPPVCSPDLFFQEQIPRGVQHVNLGKMQFKPIMMIMGRRHTWKPLSRAGTGAMLCSRCI